MHTGFANTPPPPYYAVIFTSRRTEGDRQARWILMDYLDCVVHIFTPEARSFYRLEQLWGEVPARSVG